jgi:hypothetical protein
MVCVVYVFMLRKKSKHKSNTHTHTMSLASNFTKFDRNQPEQFFLSETFHITGEGRLVFFADTTRPTTPLPDFSKLPEDIVREILTYLREPSAECIATQMFLTTGIHKSVFRQGVQVYGKTWINLDGRLIYHRLYTIDRGRVYKKNYDVLESYYGCHLSPKLWKEAHERISKFKYDCKKNKMTPTEHKAWLRQQLEMNNICPTRASRKTQWKLFMALD